MAGSMKGYMIGSMSWFTSCRDVDAVAAGADAVPVRGSAWAPVSTVLRSAPEPSVTYSRCALCAERGSKKEYAGQGDVCRV